VRNTFRGALFLCVLAAGAPGAASAATPAEEKLAQELRAVFKSYMVAVRKDPDPNDPEPCARPLSCVADHFTRGYLANSVQSVADAATRDYAARAGVIKSSLRFGINIEKAYSYAAKAIGAGGAELTFAASNATGDCLPLIRVAFRQESAGWRIDSLAIDTSTPQTCEAAALKDDFAAPPPPPKKKS
jgi:hypothetical protein